MKFLQLEPSLDATKLEGEGSEIGEREEKKENVLESYLAGSFASYQNLRSQLYSESKPTAAKLEEKDQVIIHKDLIIANLTERLRFAEEAITTFGEFFFFFSLPRFYLLT